MSSNILAKKAVLATLSLSRWGARRLDRKVTDEIHAQHNAQGDVGRYNKKLVTKEQIAPIVAVITAARNYHYSRTLPWLDDGARILPSSIYLEYAEKMREFRRNWDIAVADFVKEYPGYIADAKKRMNGLFNAADYPSPREIGRHFAFDVAILPCPDTEDFRIAVEAEHVDDIRRDVEARLEETLKGTLRETAERIAETVGHMSERLKAYKPATRQGERAEGQFRDSLVNNVRELAKLLPAFNLAGDPKLAKVIMQIERELCTNDAETLRNDGTKRKKVAKSADAILAAVSDFIA